MQEVRLQFSKEGRAVYISHLDVMRCFSRAMGRAGLPVHYTQGFNPQPYLVFSPPLSLGYAGQAEFCDFSLEDDALPLEQVAGLLAATMPEGLCPKSSAAPVHKLGLLHKATYTIALELGGGSVATAEEVEACLTRSEITVIKKSKRRQIETNIAPLIEQLSVETRGNGIMLFCRLAVVGEGALNPRYLVEVLQRDLPQLDIADSLVTRQAFFLEDDAPFC